MALHVPAVLQAQRAEVVVGQLAGEMALELVAELRGALVHELAVEFVVSVHAEAVVVAVRRRGPQNRNPMGARQPLRDGTGDSSGADARREPHIRQIDIPMRHKERTPGNGDPADGPTAARREWFARLAALGGLGALGLAGCASRGVRPAPSWR